MHVKFRRNPGVQRLLGEVENMFSNQRPGRPFLYNRFVKYVQVPSTFLVHLSRRLKCTILIMRCPSSVVCRPSVRPSSLTFHIFDFSSETAKRNSTKLDRKQDINVLYQVCVFRADQKNKMAALASDWLRHFRLLLWNRWTEFNKTWQEERFQCPLPSLCFSGQSKKQDGPQASDWLRHFRLLLWNRWTEFNKTWQKERSWFPLPSLCFSGRLEKQDGRPASDWLRHYQLLLWNRWMEFDETWQEARYQCPLPSLCFSGRWEKQDGGPGLWLAETFSTSPLKPLNSLQWNLTGRKISTSCTKFVFFGLIGKTRWPPWPISQKGGTLYSGARYVALCRVKH